MNYDRHTHTDTQNENMFLMPRWFFSHCPITLQQHIPTKPPTGLRDKLRLTELI